MRDMKAQVRKRGSGRWAVVVEVGEQPARKCVGGCRRGGGVVTLWPEDDSIVCPRCKGPLTPPVPVRRQRWVSGFDLKREAEAHLAEMRAAVGAGGTAFPKPQTVREYVEQWLVGHATKVRPSTLNVYRSYLQRFVLPRVGDLDLHALTPGHLDVVWTRMRDEDKVAPATIRQTRAALSKALNVAVKHRVITFNPCAATEPPRCDRPVTADLTATHVRAVLAAVEDDERWHLPVLIAAHTGMRRSEILGLRWGDIDFVRGVVQVERGLHARPGQNSTVADRYYLADPKSERSRRSVALSAPLVSALRAHKRVQAERRLACGAGWQGDAWGDLVVDRGNGEPVAPDDFSRAFSRLARRLGLPTGARLHDLRHALVANLLDEGVEIDVISRALGHSTTAFTYDRYTHLRTHRRDEVAAAVGRAYGG